MHYWLLAALHLPSHHNAIYVPFTQSSCSFPLLTEAWHGDSYPPRFALFCDVASHEPNKMPFFQWSLLSLWKSGLFYIDNFCMAFWNYPMFKINVIPIHFGKLVFTNLMGDSKGFLTWRQGTFGYKPRFSQHIFPWILHHWFTDGSQWLYFCCPIRSSNCPTFKDYSTVSTMSICITSTK